MCAATYPLIIIERYNSNTLDFASNHTRKLLDVVVTTIVKLEVDKKK